MSQISEKLQSFCKKLRSSEIQSRLKQMREQILRSCQKDPIFNSTEEMFKLTICKLEQPEKDELNIYVNIKKLLQECLFTNQKKSKLRKKVALWIFIKLTLSSEVINFMVEYDMKENWKNFIYLLQQQLKCREYLYAAMKNFLQIACSKFHITSYHNLDSLNLNEAVNFIFSQQITSTLLSIEPQHNEDSQYSQFLATYIGFVPKEHIVPIINEGFALRVIQLANKRIFYSILSRLQSLSEQDESYLQIFQSLLQKKEEIELIFLEFQ